ncbi:unnamed protein product [Adineta ricciae]|uniref:Endonuclease/exonuclease/phosphatase domain-containing protein n=1 Tax=Adineta ricciae TaxID=249248 RepID=A0A813NQP4_ADIRI|nr:unnamed protein product [Adineta ricciae]CAF0792986.1 unnamed protein product [Adineta ricciae]
MTTLRVATVNVHSFRQPRSISSNVTELSAILAPLNLDVIAVQEMQENERWREFSQRLSLPFSVYGPPKRTFCNGIISRYPIHWYSVQRTDFFCEGGTRSMLQFSLEGIQNMKFALTHLDHRNEDDRLRQIQKFRPHEDNIDILIGDLNALTREDYSNSYYRDIVLGKREKADWERPRFDLTELITKQWKYQDTFRKLNPTLKDKQVATCPYGTRIDYIYTHPRMNEYWKLIECSIIDTNGATDHHAVIAEFKQITKYKID